MTSFAKPYSELSLDELYEILRVRAEIFGFIVGILRRNGETGMRALGRFIYGNCWLNCQQPMEQQRNERDNIEF